MKRVLTAIGFAPGGASLFGGSNASTVDQRNVRMPALELRTKGVITMKTARSRFASIIAVASLIFGAAACEAPSADEDTEPTPGSVHDTASPQSSEDHAAVAATQSSDEADLDQPSPADLSFEDEKIEKDIDCCVIKDSIGNVCACFRMSGGTVINSYNCWVSGGEKRGSGCGAYADCNHPIGICGL